jgi:hypothetical protein
VSDNGWRTFINGARHLVLVTAQVQIDLRVPLGQAPPVSVVCFPRIVVLAWMMPQYRQPTIDDHHCLTCLPWLCSAYVDNLNKQISGKDWDNRTLEEIVLASWNNGSPTPEFNNAAQVGKIERIIPNHRDT